MLGKGMATGQLEAKPGATAAGTADDVNLLAQQPALESCQPGGVLRGRKHRLDQSVEQFFGRLLVFAVDWWIHAPAQNRSGLSGRVSPL